MKYQNINEYLPAKNAVDKKAECINKIKELEDEISNLQRVSSANVEPDDKNISIEDFANNSANEANASEQITKLTRAIRALKKLSIALDKEIMTTTNEFCSLVKKEYQDEFTEIETRQNQAFIDLQSSIIDFDLFHKKILCITGKEMCFTREAFIDVSVSYPDVDNGGHADFYRSIDPSVVPKSLKDRFNV